MKVEFGSRRGRRGISLVELAITLTLLATFLATLLQLVNTGSRAARTGMARQSIEGLARRTLDRMASELVRSSTATLDPDPVAPFGSAQLTFQCLEGYANGAVQWEDPVRFALELEPGELDDGDDDDGDGLVDERQLVCTRDVGGPEETSTVLAHGVRELLQGESANGADDNANGLLDEAGLSFQHSGGRLILRLSLEEVDHDRNRHVCTVETSVRLRNSTAGGQP